jgi:hypothetical protein
VSEEARTEVQERHTLVLQPSHQVLALLEGGGHVICKVNQLDHVGVLVTLR